MNTRSMVSPEEQNVTFVELFFDLVFVFSVTQVVGLLHGHITPGAVGGAILVFWLVWWAWTQFTWALNAADTTHQFVESVTLAAVGVAFLMAVALPGAYDGRALWFAVPYVLVRGLGLLLYILVTRGDADQNRAVRTFALFSTSGLVAVLLGAWIGGVWQYAFWGGAILLDLLAANVSAGSEYWNLHSEHFAERHGLFVIIALGETLIVAAGGVITAEWSGPLIGVALLAVATTCALWWSYFPQAKPTVDHALERRSGHTMSEMARDAYSLIHFPMLCGVIAYAVAVEEAVAHPDDPLPLAGRLMLAAVLFLFVGGMAAAIARTSGRLPRGLAPRLLIVFGVGAVLVALPLTAPLSLALLLSGLVVLAVAEHFVASPNGGRLVGG